MLKIYTSPLNYISSENVLKSLIYRDRSKKHIILPRDIAI